MNTEFSDKAIGGDRPLRNVDRDRLGFREVAARIALSLAKNTADEGLVIGLEGKWGSGKSSLLYLVQAELTDLANDRGLTVINFRPWLIGDREALLANLFQELSAAIDDVCASKGDQSGRSVAKAKDASKAIRQFVSKLARAGEVVTAAGDITGIPGINILGKLIKSLRHFDPKSDEPSSLAESKSKLEKALKDLDHRFIITIDDVDRLDPREAIEVLRLTRSVADLPNLIYILCFDRDMLAHSVEKASDIQDGRSYLEKIIQLTIMVPRPETFQLRQWFSTDLSEIAVPKTEDGRARLEAVIDVEGGVQLKTPRSVVRALDSMRFWWGPLQRTGVDLADLVWLQLIKDGNPSLYRWIENYSTTAASLSLGIARVEENEKCSTLAQLRASIEKDILEDIHYRHHLSDILPGIELVYDSDDEPFKLYQHVPPFEKDISMRDCRLASPDHYRFYFALAGPSHALVQADFDELWQATAAAPSDTAELLLRWHGVEVSGSLGKADVALERIRAAPPDVMTGGRSRHLLLALGDMLDEAYRRRPFDRHWVISLWSRAERLLPDLLASFADEERREIVAALFSRGRAITWLTHLFRRETFAQGRYGDRRRSDTEWLFSASELDIITEIMLKRYRSMTVGEIFATIDPITLLFAWRQGGDENGPRALVESHTKSDAGLVSLLELLTSTVTAENGRFKILSRENVDPFISCDAAAQRLGKLAADDAAPVLAARAKRLLQAIADGKLF